MRFSLNLFLAIIFVSNFAFLQGCKSEEKETAELKIPPYLFTLWVPISEIFTARGDIRMASEEINEFLKDKKNLEAKNKCGQTPLVIAVNIFNGQNLVKHLLDLGANIETVDKFGHTPLEHAVYTRNPETVKILLEHGAKIHPKYLEHAETRYAGYKDRLGDENKAEGFKKIIDLLNYHKQKREIIAQETGIPKDVIEWIILPYDTEINC